MYYSKDAIKNYFGQDYSPFYRFYLQDKFKAKDKSICCFHTDNNPSLSIDTKTGYFCCHGCRESGDIFSFYGKKFGHDPKNGGFPAITEGIAKDFGISAIKQDNGYRNKEPFLHPKLGKPDVIYDYTDEQGKLLYHVCRFQLPNNKKTFRQCKPGGFIWSLKGVKRVLYHLPELKDAQQVLICEGEKDVDNVRGLGFIATTNSEGAEKWKDEFSDCLRDKDIIIFPDNDKSGQKHLNQVTLSLQGKARSIKVIQLPGVKDVSDFINTFRDDKGGAAERLSMMIEGAREYEPKETDALEEETDSEEEGFIFAERPKIPDSKYIAKCINYSRKPVPCLKWGTHKIFLTFEIIEGPYQGEKTFMPFNVGNGELPLGCKYRKYWTLINGKEPSRNAKVSSRIFMNKIYRIKTRTVVQKIGNRPLPGGYSIVDDIELLNYHDKKKD